jgi:hypothetical protein
MKLWCALLLLVLAPLTVSAETVVLAWDPPAPPPSTLAGVPAPVPVVAYHVFRSESPSVALTSPIATVTEATYTDPTVAPGHTYYYTVTSVGPDPEKLESIESNTISVFVVQTFPSTLKGTFLGFTDDKARTGGGSGLDGRPDWQLHLTGLRSTPVSNVEITASDSRVWTFPILASYWTLAAEYGAGGVADLWISEAGLPDDGFHVKLTYNDGSIDETDVSGGVAPDPCQLQPLKITGLKWPAGLTGSRSFTWNSGTSKVKSIVFTSPSSAIFTDDRGCTAAVKK